MSAIDWDAPIRRELAILLTATLASYVRLLVCRLCPGTCSHVLDGGVR